MTEILAVLLVLFAAAACTVAVRAQHKKPWNQMTEDEQFLELDERI